MQRNEGLVAKTQTYFRQSLFTRNDNRKYVWVLRLQRRETSQIFVSRIPFCMRRAIPLSRNYEGNGYKILTPIFRGPFEQTSVIYDWSMVFKATINQSQVTLGHPNNPTNRCAESLYPFFLQFMERRNGRMGLLDMQISAYKSYCQYFEKGTYESACYICNQRQQ